MQTELLKQTTRRKNVTSLGRQKSTIDEQKISNQTFNKVVKRRPSKHSRRNRQTPIAINSYGFDDFYFNGGPDGGNQTQTLISANKIPMRTQAR